MYVLSTVLLLSLSCTIPYIRQTSRRTTPTHLRKTSKSKFTDNQVVATVDECANFLSQLRKTPNFDDLSSISHFRIHLQLISIFFILLFCSPAARNSISWTRSVRLERARSPIVVACSASSTVLRILISDSGDEARERRRSACKPFDRPRRRQAQPNGRLGQRAPSQETSRTPDADRDEGDNWRREVCSRRGRFRRAASEEGEGGAAARSRPVSGTRQDDGPPRLLEAKLPADEQALPAGDGPLHAVPGWREEADDDEDCSGEERRLITVVPMDEIRAVLPGILRTDGADDENDNKMMRRAIIELSPDERRKTCSAMI
uniref:NET domain-containing protein n=1 Tax=Steinernema glaseri TaxID=37863 RepID=A0A1I7ZIG5_9BILA